MEIACTSTRQCLSKNYYCDSGSRKCENCEFLCLPERGLVNMCKQNCPNYVRGESSTRHENTITIKPPVHVNVTYANYPQNDRVSHILVVICIILSVLIVLVFVFAWCIVRYYVIKYNIRNINQRNNDNPRCCNIVFPKMCCLCDERNNLNNANEQHISIEEVNNTDEQDISIEEDNRDYHDHTLLGDTTNQTNDNFRYKNEESDPYTIHYSARPHKNSQFHNTSSSSSSRLHISMNRPSPFKNRKYQPMGDRDGEQLNAPTVFTKKQSLISSPTGSYFSSYSVRSIAVGPDEVFTNTPAASFKSRTSKTSSIDLSGEKAKSAQIYYDNSTQTDKSVSVAGNSQNQAILPNTDSRAYSNEPLNHSLFDENKNDDPHDSFDEIEDAYKSIQLKPNYLGDQDARSLLQGVVESRSHQLLEDDEDDQTDIKQVEEVLSVPQQESSAFLHSFNQPLNSDVRFSLNSPIDDVPYANIPTAIDIPHANIPTANATIPKAYSNYNENRPLSPSDSHSNAAFNNSIYMDPTANQESSQNNSPVLLLTEDDIYSGSGNELIRRSQPIGGTSGATAGTGLQPRVIVPQYPSDATEADRRRVTPPPPETPPTNRSVHPNRRIYEILKKIQWVHGYFSEGKSIEVYIDFDEIDPETARQELVRRTGEKPEKFKVLQNDLDDSSFQFRL